MSPSFFAWTAETRSTIKVVISLYFVSDPESESESEPDSESIGSPESESESESEQRHHDSAPLLFHIQSYLSPRYGELGGKMK